MAVAESAAAPVDPAVDPAVLAGTPATASYQTTHTYADWTIATVKSTLHAGGMVTQVTDGPLHDCLEITTRGTSPDALRLQHHKWVWRVLNADLTRPEWFARKAKRRARA